MFSFDRMRFRGKGRLSEEEKGEEKDSVRERDSLPLHSEREREIL